jgi:hypothetical protein
LFNYDGKKYKVPPDIGAYFTFQKNGRTIEEKDWVGDGSKLRETDTWAIATDGATINHTVVFEPSKTRADRVRQTQVLNRRGDTPKSADDPFIGYWVEDRSKSTPYEEKLRRTPQGTESINNDGYKVLLHCDGKDYPLQDAEEGGSDGIRVRETDGTMVAEFKKHGEVMLTKVTEISADGKTKNVTGKNPKGEEVFKFTLVKVE